MKSSTLSLVLLLAGIATGCSKPPKPTQMIEPGYHHLMMVLHSVKRVHLCEQLHDDGITCYRVSGLLDDTASGGVQAQDDVCGPTRDAAAEATAKFIEGYEGICWMNCELTP